MGACTTTGSATSPRSSSRSDRDVMARMTEQEEGRSEVAARLYSHQTLKS